MTYALLIYTTRPESSPLPRDLESAMLDRHRQLQAQTSARGELLAVARLDACSKARTVTSSHANGDRDGPYMETKEWLVGFYLLECADEAMALERARSICPDAQHMVEVRPVSWHGPAH